MKAFLKKLEKNIWFYIAWLVLVIIIWDWLLGLLTRFSADEKVGVFIGCYSESFEKEQEVNDSRPDYLKAVEFNVYKVSEIYFDIRLEYHGLEESDILILSESSISEGYFYENFCEISLRYQTEISNLGVYTAEDGKVYGLKVHDKQTHESLISCLDYGEGEKEENFYLLFNKNSLHLSDLADEANKSEMDGAIKVAQRLLSL